MSCINSIQFESLPSYAGSKLLPGTVAMPVYDEEDIPMLEDRGHPDDHLNEPELLVLVQVDPGVYKWVDIISGNRHCDEGDELHNMRVPEGYVVVPTGVEINLFME